MRFRNPANGHTEERIAPWLWTLLFGGLYFIAVGVWAPLLIWLILGVVLYVEMGAPATGLVLVVNVVYAVMAGGLVRSSYLRKGWIELADGDTGAVLAGPAMVRKCPFCAEEIRVEAIKCKHCGSTVEPVAAATAAVAAGPAIGATVTPPPGVLIVDHIANVLGRNGAVASATGYVWRGVDYPSFAALVEAINLAGPGQA